jgi:hypothetical protein
MHEMDLGGEALDAHLRAEAVQRGIDCFVESGMEDAVKSGEVEVGCAMPGPAVELPVAQPHERARGTRLVPLHAPVFKRGSVYTFGGVPSWPETVPESERDALAGAAGSAADGDRSDTEYFDCRAAKERYERHLAQRSTGDGEPPGDADVAMDSSEDVWAVAAASATAAAAAQLAGGTATLESLDGKETDDDAGEAGGERADEAAPDAASTRAGGDVEASAPDEVGEDMLHELDRLFADEVDGKEVEHGREHREGFEWKNQYMREALGRAGLPVLSRHRPTR